MKRDAPGGGVCSVDLLTHYISERFRERWKNHPLAAVAIPGRFKARNKRFRCFYKLVVVTVGLTSEPLNSAGAQEKSIRNRKTKDAVARRRGG
jgi:hypothetical protein